MFIKKTGDDIPLEPREDAQPGFAEVIDLEGVRIQYGLPPAQRARWCEHKTLVYSTQERRVWCQDCETTIEAFDAFMTIVNSFEAMLKAAKHKMAQADEALRHQARRRATRELDKAWSGNVMAIACPHCDRGLLPEDFLGGGSQRSRELELARRKREAAQKQAEQPKETNNGRNRTEAD